MCDIILASPTATFGQPEINIGVVPGGGGTQRLARAIGKSRTMELTLTGRNVTAAEAAAWGMVSRVVPAEEGSVVDAAVAMAGTIAGKSRIAVQAGKDAVNAAYEGTLAEGLVTERRIFHGLFATQDQKEGACLCPKLLICYSRRPRYGRICREEEASLETRLKTPLMGPATYVLLYHSWNIIATIRTASVWTAGMLPDVFPSILYPSC